MKIWITGSNGQLGRCFQEIENEYKNHHLVFTNSKQIDITNKSAVDDFIKTNQFDSIINCAAYTKVDNAETDKENCFKVNVDSVNFLALQAKLNNIALIHFSTDYVFDGKNRTPYIETSNTNPLNIYGKSKDLGEQAIFKHNPDSVIIRTSWVYSHYGHNFVKTIVNLSKKHQVLNIINDQTSCPTFALHLAQASFKILEGKQKWSGTELLHFSNTGSATWYDFAAKIINMAQLPCQVNPIKTEEYPLPAKRPKYSLLSLQKFIDNYYEPIYWQRALHECLQKLKL